MSGHSKWANIQHRKGRQDAKRSNLWTKLVREIIVAARVGGGGDPDMNSRLRLAVLKAREGNVPKDTINNAILKGTGQLEGVSYEEVRYEGYGIGGASLIIDCTTAPVRWLTSVTSFPSTAETSAPKAPFPSSSSTAANSSLPRARTKTRLWKRLWKPVPTT